MINEHPIELSTVTTHDYPHILNSNLEALVGPTLVFASEQLVLNSASAPVAVKFIVWVSDCLG